MFKMKNIKSVFHILIILIFILNLLPLFSCEVKERRETYFKCTQNKVETKTQHIQQFVDPFIQRKCNVSNTKENVNSKDNNVQDISKILQMGIRNIIKTCQIISKEDAPIYFEKSTKFVDADLAIKGVKFQAIYPENFINLRTMYETAQEFNESFTSSSIIDEQDYENKKYSKYFYTSDYKYVIETISKNRQEILSSILFESFSHFCTYPNSLLPKYSGLYYLKYKSIEYYFIISRNIKAPINDNGRIGLFFLNGSDRIAFKTTQTQVINFQRLDNNFIKLFPKGLELPSHEQKSLVDILENDTKFLANLNMISYNLVLMFCMPINNNVEVEGSSKTISDSKKHNKPIQFNYEGEDIIIYYGIIDTLYSYDLKKKIQNAIGCISNDTVKDPTKYQKRFMQFMTSKVFTLNKKT